MSDRTQQKKDMLAFLQGPAGLAVITGKKKGGKTGFMIEAAKEASANITYFECRDTCEMSNLTLLSEKLRYEKRIRSFTELFTELTAERESRTLVLDEAQKLWKILGTEFIDCILMASTRHRVVIITSSQNLRKEFRKALFIDIKDPDYREAAEMFYPDVDARTKLGFFAVFGSSLFASSLIDPMISIKKNIKNLLLEPNGALRLYIEHELLEDLGKTGYGHTILSSLRDRRMRYSEIEMMAGQTNNGLLDKQMKILSDMSAIRRTLPINRAYDRKKALYETEDNLIRFYYTFIYPRMEELTMLGSKEFYSRSIQPELEKYIASRAEEILLQYFRNYPRTDIREAGRYLTEEKEWPVVTKDENGTTFYEIHTSGKQKLTDEEVERKMRTPVERGARKGIFSLNGFESGSDGIIRISAKDLYA